MSGRTPTRIASVSSLCARATSLPKPASENRAPAFLATERTTCWSPRSISTSVTSLLSVLRLAMALRWSWPLLRAMATRSSSLSRADWVSTGTATVLSSSKASERITLTGAFATGPRRCDSLTLALASISAASRKITSSNSATCSSE